MNNSELKGIVISRTNKTPLPQQYDTLYKAILTYAGTRPKGGAKAKKSLMKMVKLEKAIHFDSPMPTPNQYTIKNEDGVMTVDTVLQSALLTKWSDESAANSKPFNSYYQETMENLFNHII